MSNALAHEASLKLPAWFEPIAPMARAGRSRREEAELLAMYFAYFDDSADERKERFIVVGGLIADELVWDRFELLWLSATHELKEPFHATDCEGGFEEFADRVKWPKSKRDALMASLVGLIREHRLGGFASVVPVSDYRDVFPGSEKHAPYCLALKHTLVNMAQIGVDLSSNVQCWFEKGDADGESLRIFNQMTSLHSWKNGRRLTSIAFHSKTRVPLQAADLMAREAFKHHDNIGIRPVRKPVLALWNSISFHCWTRDSLEHLKGLGGQENIEALTSWPRSGAPGLQHYYPRRDRTPVPTGLKE